MAKKTTKFSHPDAIEQRLAVQLRKVARISAGIVDAHVNGSELINEQAMTAALQAYSETLEPWAKATVDKAIQAVAKRNYLAWQQAAAAMSVETRRLMMAGPIAGIFREIQARQVGLIQSIPVDLGIRAQQLSRAAVINSDRAATVAEQLANSEGVATSRATTIARTEIAATNAAITQARAEYLGIDQYIWHTVEDAEVRPSHAELDGKVFRYSDPPEIENEGRHGPGEAPNCRCYAEPIIPDNLVDNSD